MEKHYVYIIQSEVDNSLYKGYSTNPFTRLKQHNNRESRYTSKKIPWKIVYIQQCENKTQANGCVPGSIILTENELFNKRKKVGDNSNLVDNFKKITDLNFTVIFIFLFFVLLEKI